MMQFQLVLDMISKIKTRDAFPVAQIRREGVRWDDGRSYGHKNVCRWFLNRYK